MPGSKRRPKDIRRMRRDRPHSCWDHLIAAPLWPKYEENLGTLLRTCDATGACLAVPRSPRAKAAVEKGNTLRLRTCIHWVANPYDWLELQRRRSSTVVGVELAESSARLAELEPISQRTIVVLGHEGYGIPEECWELLDFTVEIPMLGSGHSLNVAVAGSLVLYKLAGLL